MQDFELPPAAPTKKVWVNFKPDVDLGHVVAMLTFLGGLFVYGVNYDRRLTLVEQALKVQEQQSAELKSDMKEIKSIVNRIATDLAVQNAIATSQAAGRKP